MNFNFLSFCRIEYLRGTAWKKNPSNPVIKSISVGEKDANGAAASLTKERLALATPVYAWIPFRFDMKYFNFSLN